eukprot:TRINITY_DN9553_c0_g1_i1.p1 TRINITY_DN9553_c0_g1~~TRINITY_DN9553_c0_g1_i1.p1  ORF type:complete len:204 (+),score=37.01 TRINITY_DN9553_c0_g1_i1:137-748(+)
MASKIPSAPNQWDTRYGSTEEYGYGEEPNAFVKESVQAGLVPKEGCVICLGCGEGRNAVFMAQQGYKVLAVDYSQEALTKTQKLADKRGVKLETEIGDFSTYVPRANTYDIIVSIFAHSPPPARKAIHAQLAQALAPGGKILMEGYTPKQLELKTGGPPAEPLMYTAEILRNEIQGVTFDRLEELERDVIEGMWHTGDRKSHV